jgi:ferric-dicitrate binding protein FerR (iron transport regulator)
MDKNRIRDLLERYADDKASTEEVEEMFELIKQAENEKVLKDLIAETREENNWKTDLPKDNWDRIWNAITLATTNHRKKFFSIAWVRVAAAAAIFLVIGGSAYLFTDKKNIQTSVVKTSTSSHYKNDIAPGGNKAVLTLANGSTIILDSTHNGVLARQGSTQILKLDDGSLTYTTENKNTGEIMYNTISTPRGGQYQITLPDGTKVWLNAASSLRFPTSFTGKQRIVELTGEAYFEVSPLLSAKGGAKVPFIVHVNSGLNGLDVQVVGTHFNIMAYENEQSINTILLEGKVNVTKNGVTKNLEPGKEAIANNQTNTLQVNDANVEQAVAWKNGYFRFKETNIHELMRQVERWYDVDVEYKTQRNDQDYTGIVPRTQNVSALLQILELTGTVHFQIEGRKIIVLP